MQWIKDLFDKICRNQLEDELEELDILRAEKLMYEDSLEELQKLRENNTDSMRREEIFNAEIERLKDIVTNNAWEIPENWLIHTAKHMTFGGKTIQPNTFICINDKELKKTLIKWRMHTSQIERLVYKLSQKIDNHISYVWDFQNKLYGKNIESWQNSNVTFKIRYGDCEDHANLFQACMHILGFGSTCRCVIGNMYWKNKPDEKVYHVWNEVLINGEWITLDSTNYNTRHLIDRYDKPEYFWNYYGTYKEE